jgi:formate/nitrite transporter
VSAGAELFTGNNLVVMAWASRRVSTGRLLGNWTLVWVGNLVGAVATAVIVYVSRQYELGGGAVGETALSIASAKTSLGFVEAVALGVLCNALVCLAVWLSYGARTTTDKVLAVIPPIAAFVAAGFEHSVANMYFLSIGLLVERDQELVAGLDGVDTSSLSWGSALVDNLLPVTIGNVIGGTVLVGAVYWFVYLRRSGRAADTSSTGAAPGSPSDSATSA